MLFLCPVSAVARFSYVPRPLPAGLEGAVGKLDGKSGGEKGSLAAVSCATRRLFVSVSSALALLSAAMVAAWLSMVAAVAMAALANSSKDQDIFSAISSRAF